MQSVNLNKTPLLKSLPIVLLLLLIAVLNNLFTEWLTPYLQKQANKHSSYGDVFDIIFYFISFSCLVLSLLASLRYKNWRNAFIFLILFLSFAFWAYRIQTLICDACATS
jgi:quinol-cytochrome oxidoreductase complex cytochrome b subunit